MTDGATSTPRKRGLSPRELTAAFVAHGLILRGGFHPEAGDAELAGIGTVFLVGNAGPAMWEAFAPHIDGGKDPLDRWTKRVIDPIDERFGARVLYPFNAEVPPFQRWALRAEAVHASPLGILIHPEYGLWHAYRAALLFTERLDLPERSTAPSPCESCAEKPCLSACPVGAFSGSAYDVAACADHVAKPQANCTSIGCHARNACPIGQVWRYAEPQTRFHMSAFARSVGRNRIAPD